MSSVAGNNSWKTTNQRMLFPDPAMQIRDHQVSSSKISEELTFSIDPQKRTSRRPLLEFCTFKEPRCRSFISGLAPNVVICRRVWRGKPSVDVLFYLCPWAEDSVSTTDAVRVGDHKHFTSSIFFDIWHTATLVLSAPKRTSAQSDVDDGPIGPRTILDISGGLQNLSYRHLNFLLYQAIEPL